MRIAICLLAILALVSVTRFGSDSREAARAATLQSDPPQISGARLKGKKLFVAGGGFQMGAVILVNGERQKTANDESNPTFLLIAKKAGKRIGPTDIVTIQVVNPDDQQSPFFRFFGGTTITDASGGSTVQLSLQQEFLVALDTTYEWNWSFSDPAAFDPVPVQLPLLGAQGVFRAGVPGEYTLTAKGDPLCSKVTPPCKLPSKFIEVQLVVK